MTLSTLALCLMGAGSAVAAGYPWKNHAGPYDFLFENDIDTHQQTRRTSSGDLFGFFYVKFSGDVTGDGARTMKTTAARRYTASASSPPVNDC